MSGMLTENSLDLMVDALTGRYLLSHPFYRRWEEGGLAEGELGAYAEQYRLIERELPLTLAAVALGLPDGRARRMVEANLADELSVPEPHCELFEKFAGAAGAGADVGPSLATAALLAGVRAAAAKDPVAALAMVAAYEVQAADIAATKAEGLRVHYGMDAEGTCFWDLHATQEIDHADWSLDALDALGADPVVVYTAAWAAAQAWWDFLTEREESAPATAGV
jgi:pyrroloquinoline quinone (PQQ) biosynthesis protein C